jgi:hypothetical protein
MKRQIARIARAPDDESANAALRFAVRSAHWSGRLVRLRDLWPAFSIRAAQMSSLEFLRAQTDSTTKNTKDAVRSADSLV